MRELMAQYLRLPAISLRLSTRPVELDDAAIKALSDEINTQVQAAVFPFLTEMLRDLCFAEAKLCQFEGTSSLGTRRGAAAEFPDPERTTTTPEAPAPNS